MKRVGWRWLLVLLAGGFLATAQAPDDQFLRVYGLIQQGDLLQTNGRPGEARERYREALTLLLELERQNPRWNPQILSFRKRYLEERVGTAAAPPAAGPTTAPAAGPAEDPRIAALQEELGQLRAERDRLQAKLREALAAQPAAVDPRELEAAQTRIANLLKETESLRAEIAVREQRLAAAPSAARLDEMQKALDDARQNLTRQTELVASLTQQSETLKRELARAREQAPAPAPVVTPAPDDTATRRLEAELDTARQDSATLKERNAALLRDIDAERQRSEMYRSEKAALETKVAELNARKPEPPPQTGRDTGSRQQVAALEQRLEKLDRELAAERERASTLKSEKETLERRLATLTATAAPAPASTNAAPAKPSAPSEREEKAMAKYQREVDRVKIRQLERERDDLNKRLRVLTRQVEDFQRQTGATNTSSGADQLAILRARIEAYEARAVPFSPEELALMKTSAGTPAVPEATSGKRSLRQVPAGAATLLAEAQRAFMVRRYDEAERKFQQALQLDERNVDMLTYLAAAQLEQDRFTEAEATLTRALAADPNSPDGVSLMGLLRFRQNKYEEAFDLLSRAAQLNPDNPYTQNYLGVTLSQRGQRKAAETALRRAVALDAGYGEAHANLAVVYALGQPAYPELARYHYQKALALGQPKNPELEKFFAGAAPAPATPAPEPPR